MSPSKGESLQRLPGRVDEVVKGPGGFKESLDGGGVRQVEHVAFRACGKHRQRTLDPRLVSGRDKHLGAILCRGFRHRQTDAGCSSENDDPFVLQSHGNLHLRGSISNLLAFDTSAIESVQR